MNNSINSVVIFDFSTILRAQRQNLNAVTVHENVFFVLCQEETWTFTFPELETFMSKNEIVFLLIGDVQNKSRKSIEEDCFESDNDFFYFALFIS